MKYIIYVLASQRVKVCQGYADLIHHSRLLDMAGIEHHVIIHNDTKSVFEPIVTKMLEV